MPLTWATHMHMGAEGLARALEPRHLCKDRGSDLPCALRPAVLMAWRCPFHRSHSETHLPLSFDGGSEPQPNLPMLPIMPMYFDEDGMGSPAASVRVAKKSKLQKEWEDFKKEMEPVVQTMTLKPDDKFTKLLSEKINQDMAELNELKAVAKGHIKTVLVDLDLESMRKLALLPKPIVHMGLFDPGDIHVLRLSLYDEAGMPPPTSEPFNEADRSTWSMEALLKLDIRQLAAMQAYTSRNYTCLLNKVINILKLDKYSCNNVIPFHENFFPVDKSSLRDLSSSLKFRLLNEVFETGTKYNTRAKLQRLKKLLFCTKPGSDQSTGWPGEADSYELQSSPLNAITLPDAARSKAAIPENALFYSFCHPVVQNVDIPDVIKHGGDVCWFDPFVVWLTTGAFIYYDFQFDVVGINAVCFDEVDLKEGTTSTLCLGDSSPLPLSAIQPLQEYGRWMPLTALVPAVFGFTHLAYITPSEFLGDSIFPMAGGFAYLHRDDGTWQEPEEEGEQKAPAQSRPSSLRAPVPRWGCRRCLATRVSVSL